MGRILRKRAVQVRHGLQRGLPTRAGHQASDRLVVALDNDLLAIDGQSVKDRTQIAREIRRCDGFHRASSA